MPLWPRHGLFIRRYFQVCVCECVHVLVRLVLCKALHNCELTQRAEGHVSKPTYPMRTKAVSFNETGPIFSISIGFFHFQNAFWIEAKVLYLYSEFMFYFPIYTFACHLTYPIQNQPNFPLYQPTIRYVSWIFFPVSVVSVDSKSFFDKFMVSIVVFFLSSSIF